VSTAVRTRPPGYEGLIRATGRDARVPPYFGDTSMITNRQLRDALLRPQMLFYFECKLAPLLSDEVLARIEEALKFLNMACHCNGDIPVSKEIDDVWHLWILETVEYDRLCAKLSGGVFLHHSSNDYALFTDPGAKSRKIDRTAGIAILASYVMNYGPFAADRLRYWPLADRLVASLGGDLVRFNALLQSPSRVLPARELA
jgi:hypothetical protein